MSREVMLSMSSACPAAISAISTAVKTRPYEDVRRTLVRSAGVSRTTGSSRSCRESLRPPSTYWTRPRAMPTAAAPKPRCQSTSSPR
ncbi:hypothetical protein [Streptomyces sp. NPDC091371]|uniref:hypothetical protein n=1 Tax=Streptomyces sp. NPDC091371 TaxID=3155303 RepID=UPI00342FBBC0